MADPVPPSIPPQVRAALESGNLIQAIKLMREQMPQLGLAEAKSLVDALQRQGVKVNVKTNVKTPVRSAPHAQPAHVVAPHHHAPMPDGLPTASPGLSPGEVPRTSASAALMFVAIAIFAVIAAAVYFSR